MTLKGELLRNGYAVIDGAGVWSVDDAERAVAHVGKAIKVYPDSVAKTPWASIPVDPARNRGRFGGTGWNGLHVDFVNMDLPPDYVMFKCYRPDVGGGGQTIIADMRGIENDLSPQTRTELSRTIYADGKGTGLVNVGVELRTFPVLDPGASVWKYRWTNRLLSWRRNTLDTLVALTEMHEALLHRVRIVHLKEDEMLLVDQRVCAHGRAPLVGDQRMLALDERRSIQSIYFRSTVAPEAP